jgi:hypothetical protein
MEERDLRRLMAASILAGLYANPNIGPFDDTGGQRTWAPQFAWEIALVISFNSEAQSEDQDWSPVSTEEMELPQAEIETIVRSMLHR